MPHLALPNVKFKQSYIAAVKEFQAEQQKDYVTLNIVGLERDFETHVQAILNQAKGIGLPVGYVPQTTYWLVEGDEFLGSVDIRHELNETLRAEGGHIGYDIRPSQRRKGYGSLILQLGLVKAKELGITDPLVTCNKDNIGSNKIIIKNGGKIITTGENTLKLNKNYYRIIS